MSTRLDTAAPDLAQLVADASDKRCRDLAFDAAAAAASRVPLTDDVLALIASRRVGDAGARAAVERLTSELDELAWNIQEQLDEGVASEDEYAAAFERARAAMAVWFALDPRPRVAAEETIYEAIAAIGEAAVREALWA